MITEFAATSWAHPSPPSANPPALCAAARTCPCLHLLGRSGSLDEYNRRARRDAETQRTSLRLQNIFLQTPLSEVLLSKMFLSNGHSQKVFLQGHLPRNAVSQSSLSSMFLSKTVCLQNALDPKWFLQDNFSPRSFLSKAFVRSLSSEKLRPHFRPHFLGVFLTFVVDHSSRPRQ